MKEDMTSKYIMEEKEFLHEKYDSVENDVDEELENAIMQKNLDTSSDKDVSKKMETSLLVNLLEKFKSTEKYSSESDYSNDESEDLENPNESSTLKTNYSSLLQAMTSCSINTSEKSATSKKYHENNNNVKITHIKNDSCTISDVHALFDSESKNKMKSSAGSKYKSEEVSKNKYEMRISKADTRNYDRKGESKESFIEKDRKCESVKRGDKTRNGETVSTINKLTLDIAAIQISNKAKISSYAIASSRRDESGAKDSKHKTSKSQEKKSDDEKNLNDKDSSQKKEGKCKKLKKKVLVFLERGPWTTPKKHGTTPYENQVNRRFLSGGTVWSENQVIDCTPKTIANHNGYSSNAIVGPLSHAEESLQVPQQVPERESTALSSSSLELATLALQLEQDCVRLYDKGNDFENWEEDLSMIMEILENDSRPPKKSSQNQEFIQSSSLRIDGNNVPYPRCQETTLQNKSSPEIVIAQSYPKKNLINDNDRESYYCTNVHPPPHQQFSEVTFAFTNCESSNLNEIQENQTLNVCGQLTIPSSSPYQLYSPRGHTPDLRVSVCSSKMSAHSPLNYNFNDSSPEQCYNSPNYERIESTRYDNLYELSIPSSRENLRESFSSSSPIDSPRFDLVAKTFELENNAFETSPNSNSSGSYIYSQGIQEPGVLDEFCVLPQTEKYDEGAFYDPSRVLDFGANTYAKQLSIDEIKKQLEKEANEIIDNNMLNVLSMDAKMVKAPTQTKSKDVPIAAKRSYPCCSKQQGNDCSSKKNAKDIMDEMFERLDDKMKTHIHKTVHNLDQEDLMKLLDWLLSSWGECAGMKMPRLPLMYQLCERLLMRAATMTKFFKTYGNGHTILDRAILTCSQTPLLSKYLAECCLRASVLLPHDNDYIIDKSDTLGNGVIHRAVSCGVPCASSLAALLALETDRSIININRLNADGYSPLHIACTRHSPQEGGLVCSCLVMAHVLLEHGCAAPNVKDGTSGNTALHTAVDSNSCAPSLVSLLLKYGADTSIKNYRSLTPLDLAKSAGRSSNAPHAKQVVDIMKRFKRQ